MSKDLVLNLEIYHIFEKKGRARRISSFFRTKEGRRTYQGWYRTLLIDHANEATGALWDWNLLFL
jgi:hypothetical protein